MLQIRKEKNNDFNNLKKNNIEETEAGLHANTELCRDAEVVYPRIQNLRH